MKILFLYTEIATYFLAGVKALLNNYDCEVKIVRWPVNAQAPFNFTFSGKLDVYDRDKCKDEDLQALVDTFQPDMILLSGWADKGYVTVARRFKKKGGTTVCMMDNQWFGTIRQKIATLLSPVFLKSTFDFFWVPGMFQYEYARRLGYPREKILTGMYCSEQPDFFAAHQNYREAKSRSYPHTFLYVGRLSPEKGTLNLYHAFRGIQNKKGWRLIFIGAGPEGAFMKENEHIEIRGFVQPKDLPDLTAEGGCLVFPSLRDAWGVSIHEFAAAGLPLVVSDAAGATTAFLKHGYNGFLFKRGNESSLQNALQRIIHLSDEKLLKMGDRSAILSKQITPDSWAATLVGMLDEYYK